MRCNALPLRCVILVAGLLLAVCLPARGGLCADAPRELAGIRLGESLDEAGAALVRPEAERAFHQPYLGLAPVAPVPGYRSGYVDYGLCARPGRIVRIKMNYGNDSLEFFNRLMTMLTTRYGEPREWRGNAFGTLRTWKWSLRMADTNQPVSLILMHYEGEDGAFTEGNSIRLSATGMVREEEACYAAKNQHAVGQKGPQAMENGEQPRGLDWFLPR